MHASRTAKEKQGIMMECPYRCSHHTFPNHFKFCPYCGSKLEQADHEAAAPQK